MSEETDRVYICGLMNRNDSLKSFKSMFTDNSPVLNIEDLGTVFTKALATYTVALNLDQVQTGFIPRSGINPNSKYLSDWFGQLTLNNGVVIDTMCSKDFLETCVHLVVGFKNKSKYRRLEYFHNNFRHHGIDGLSEMIYTDLIDVFNDLGDSK